MQELGLTPYEGEALLSGPVVMERAQHRARLGSPKGLLLALEKIVAFTIMLICRVEQAIGGLIAIG